MKNWDPGLSPSLDGFDQANATRDSADEAKRLRARIAVLNQRIDRLLRQTDRDELTNLSNRRAFIVELNKAIGRCKRYDEETALIIFDLDREDIPLTDLDDDSGDQISVVVAETLRNNIRSVDTVARLRGDEFAVLMDHLSFETASKKVAGLTLVVETILAAQPVAGPKLHWGLTMILPDDTIAEAMTRADFALFENRAAQRSAR